METGRGMDREVHHNGVEGDHTHPGEVCMIPFNLRMLPALVDVVDRYRTAS
jgi:hypothetical protein